MITKEQVKTIAEDYLNRSSLEYNSLCELDEIKLLENHEIPFGKNTGQIQNVYFFHFTQIWGIEERALGLYIDANGGELLYVITPQNYIKIEDFDE